MTDQNPYESPNSEVSDPLPDNPEALQALAAAQRFAILVVLAYIGMLVLAAFVENETVLNILGVAVLVGGMVAIARLSRALGHGWGITILFLFLLLLPLIGLILLLVLNARATKRVKEAGYTVGLLGAKRSH